MNRKNTKCPPQVSICLIMHLKVEKNNNNCCPPLDLTVKLDDFMPSKTNFLKMNKYIKNILLFHLYINVLFFRNVQYI